MLALVVLGPERLPQAARTVGRWAGELRRLTGSLEAEVRDVADEVMRPVNEAATVASGPFPVPADVPLGPHETAPRAVPPPVDPGSN